VERLLLIAGAAMLTWCVVWIGDGVLAQRIARESLETLLPVPLSPARGEATPVAPRDSVPHIGAPIAALSIPRIELSAAVLHGSDARTLRRGPGHLEHTALPGEPGHVVIAGHRDSFFRRLQYIRPGDDIFLDTTAGRLRYQVTSLRVVDPHDVGVIAPAEDSVLTLITCYPFSVFGNAPNRFVVRAVAVTAGGSPLAPPRPKLGVEAAVAVTVADDAALVREAVERFRVAYNAGVLRGSNGQLSIGRLGLQACDVDVTAAAATATCRATPESGDLHVRTFSLRRAPRGWAITSVVLD
jgi:sortase A